jgi:pilus assembly protein CpaF
MLPQRPSGTSAPPVARTSGSLPSSRDQSFEAVKARVVAKLEDRLNPAASKRMPSSILRQSLRTQAEQIAEVEGNRLSPSDRGRLVDEALADVLGYGPLDELFRDSNVREVMVAGPHAVLVRRDTAGWLPTSVRFRDETHLRAAIDRLATHADPVGGVTASVNTFDLKLPNGFRAIAVIPPDALGQAPSIAFVRIEANPPPLAAEPAMSASGRLLNTAATRSLSGSVPTPATRSGVNPTPPARPSPLERTPSAERDPLARYRKPILERLIAKFANHGIYDLQRVDVSELRRVIAAHIGEYCSKERVYLSDADQGRLILEILTTVQR